MIFKEKVSITASAAGGTTFATRELVGNLMMLRLIRGTMTTKKTMVFGVSRGGVDDSTTCAFLTVALKTSDLNYYPRQHAVLGAAASTDVRCPVPLANDKIKIWIQQSTDASAVTATALFYIDGAPGIGGTTTT